MNKYLKVVPMILSLGFAMVGCSDDDNKDKTPLQTPYATIKATVLSFEGLDSETYTWKKNASIGVYGYASETAPLEGSDQNKRYMSLEGNDSFTPANKYNDAIILGSNPLTFIAYYPYIEKGKEGVIVLNIANQSNLNTIDYMVAKNIEVVKEENTLQPQFAHLLSKVNIRINAPQPEFDLSTIKIGLDKVYTFAEYNLFTQEFVLSEDNLKTLSLNPKVVEKGATASGLLIPSASKEDAEITISFIYKGQSFNINRRLEPTTFESNKIYNFTVDIKDEDLVVLHTKGTKEDPYTIPEALNNIDKKEVWTKAYVREIMPDKKWVIIATHLNAGDPKPEVMRLVLANSPIEAKMLNLVAGDEILVMGNISKPASVPLITNITDMEKLNKDNEVESAKGSKENPFTTVETYDNEGQTGVWVKGVIQSTDKKGNRIILADIIDKDVSKLTLMRIYLTDLDDSAKLLDLPKGSELKFEGDLKKEKNAGKDIMVLRNVKAYQSLSEK